MVDRLARRRGPPPKYAAVPTSPEIAHQNLVAGLTREHREALYGRVFKALNAGLAAARVPRLKRAAEYLALAVDELDTLAKESGPPAPRPPGPSFLDEALGNPGPDEPTISGAFALERDARARAGTAMYELTACVQGYSEQAAKILPLPRRPTKLGAVALWKDPLEAAGDFLAPALADLEWVRGGDAAQLAIFMHVDQPVRLAADLEDRRKRWDKRLSAARMRTPRKAR